MFGLSYWFLPLFAGCVWLGTLLAMLGTWLAKGSPHYGWMQTSMHIAYISDIGATSWGRPLFIAGSAVAVVIFDVAFISERWLRHKGRLAKNYNKVEKALSICAIIFAIIGAAGLILLTIFDTKDYPNVHDAMLVVFIAGYIISAIFICAEYQRLGIHYREHRVLRSSFWIKLAFIFIELALAIAFGVESDRSVYNRAAVLEWTISLIYIFYIWSFIIDFLPATHTKHKNDRFGAPVRAGDDEMAMNTQEHGNNMGGPVYTGGGHQQDSSSYDSEQPMAEMGRYQAPQGHVPASRNF